MQSKNVFTLIFCLNTVLFEFAIVSFVSLPYVFANKTRRNLQTFMTVYASDDFLKWGTTNFMRHHQRFMAVFLQERSGQNEKTFVNALF